MDRLKWYKLNEWNLIVKKKKDFFREYNDKIWIFNDFMLKNSLFIFTFNDKPNNIAWLLIWLETGYVLF